MELIAELCQNHNGDLALLDKMVTQAAQSCDIVKIQTILADTLTKRDEYETHRPYDAEYERLKGLELDFEAESWFIQRCKELGTKPMTTLFTPDHLPRFRELGYRLLKLSGYSIPAFNYGLALEGLDIDHLYFSNSSLEYNEIEKTIDNLNKLGINYTMLQCTCVYPTPVEKSMIHNIRYLKEKFNLKSIGYSDHSNPWQDGLLVPFLAIFEGIDVLERHFTILGPEDTRDGKVSINPEMAKLLREFSLFSKQDQFEFLNKFNSTQEFNHAYYRERFK